MLGLALLLAAGAPGLAVAGEKPAAIVESHVRCLLGGASANQWISDDDMAASLAGGESYRVFTAAGPAGDATGAKPESAGAACQGTLAVQFSAQPVASQGFVAIAGGAWNPARRPVQDITAAKARYQPLFREFLASKGIREPAQIRELYRVDLDGDGKDEVVAVVQNFDFDGKSSDGGGRRYSLVAVRRLVGKRVETVALELESDPREGGVSDHHIPFILDLNGDGVLDIVVYGRYLQGVFSAVYSLEKGRFRRVLSCACGG